MEAKPKSALSFVVLTLSYWVPAAFFIALSMLGDCFKAADVCQRSFETWREQIFSLSLLVYLLLVALWSRPRRR